MKLLGWMLSVAFAVDSSGPAAGRKPDLPVERLGNVYSYVGPAVDRGLEVEVWRNESLGREETWYKPDGEEFFLRVNETTYVLGRHQAGEWVTVPSRRLALRGGEWKPLGLKSRGR